MVRRAGARMAGGAAARVPARWPADAVADANDVADCAEAGSPGFAEPASVNLQVHMCMYSKMYVYIACM
jgi:hypothetical protein